MTTQELIKKYEKDAETQLRAAKAYASRGGSLNETAALKVRKAAEESRFIADELKELEEIRSLPNCCTCGAIKDCNVRPFGERLIYNCLYWEPDDEMTHYAVYCDCCGGYSVLSVEHGKYCPYCGSDTHVPLTITPIDAPELKKGENAYLERAKEIIDNHLSEEKEMQGHD